MFWIGNDSKISTMFWTTFGWKISRRFGSWTAAVGKRAKTDFRQLPASATDALIFPTFPRTGRTNCATNQSAASTKLQLCRLLPQHRPHRFGITFSESSLSVVGVGVGVVVIGIGLFFFWPERKNSRCGGCLWVLFLWLWPLAHVCCVRSVTLRLDGKTAAWDWEDSKTRDTQTEDSRPEDYRHYPVYRQQSRSSIYIFTPHFHSQPAGYRN